jgi:hypothetical protein|tara:strand:- start:429 stop:911 length:483 start_codon:yes stop_codon:yes gene_type:complete
MAIHLTSSGLDFSGLANHAGMSGEVLDDYEEGIWTAVQASGGSVATSGSIMLYHKVGTIALLNGQFRQGGSQSSGNLQLTAIPFACLTNLTNNNAITIGSVRLYQQDLAGTVGDIAGCLCNIEGGASTIEMLEIKDNAATTNVQRDDEAYCAIGITYPTA